MSDFTDDEELESDCPLDEEQAEEDRVDDVNYRLVLLAKRARDKKEAQLKTQRVPMKKPTRKKKRPKHRSPSPQSDEEPSESSESENETEKAIDRDIQLSQQLEESRITRQLNAIQARKEEEKDYATRAAWYGVVSASNMLDTALGFDGSFAQDIMEDQELRVLVEKEVSRVNVQKKVIAAAGSWGIPMFILMKFVAKRPELVDYFVEKLGINLF